MSFSMFFFLSLAFVKRYTELITARDGRTREPGQRLSGRGYMLEDIELILAPSGFVCGHAQRAGPLPLHQQPGRPEALPFIQRALWLICPILLYWIARVWFLACRQQLADDPVLFAIKDRISLIAGLVVIAVLAVSI